MRARRWTATTSAALTHGVATAFYGLAAVAALGAVLAAVVVESAPPVAAVEADPGEELALEAAA